MKHVFTFGFLLLSLMWGAYTALGCTCADLSARERFRKADYVFFGTVTRITQGSVPYFPTDVTFKVERQWKGARLKDPLIHFSFDTPGMCGDLHLAEGRKFLIYANRKNRDLISNTDCGPNREQQYAGKEMQNLNRFWFRWLARVSPR